jgi:dCMP deaminase
MDMAELTASLSYATRLQVGALIVKGNRVIGTGYNGMPTDWENECEINGITKSEVLHAETNAIAKVAQSTESSSGATLFCTHAPCIDCAKLIFQSGITTLYYRNEYRDDQGVKFLKLGESMYIIIILVKCLYERIKMFRLL